MLALFYEDRRMKDFISKPTNFTRVEFWAATTIFVFVVFFFISDVVSRQWTAPTAFSFYFSKLTRYALIYGGFLILNFTVVPTLIKKENLLRNILLIVLLYLVVSVVFSVTDTYLKPHLFKQYKTEQDTYNYIFQVNFLYAAWLMFVFALYSIIKYWGMYLLSKADAIRSKYKFVTPAGLTAIIIWMVCMLLLITARAHGEITLAFGILSACGILLFWYSFHSLIPRSLGKRRSFAAYMSRCVVVLALTFLPILFLLMLITDDGEGSLGLGTFNAFFQLLIIAPLSWVLFKRQMKGNEELYVLKKELGQTNANFDFLRSQINPHFLFNALNTIYGTAIQEKAERTSEGIEKLGDMMRFMLQENMQEKISLAREIEYLNNYIDLQKLRTDPNPIVKIQAHIEQPLHPVQIAPMLLIPFVENAFKHGISFREESFIKITLEFRDGTLYFDVYNSKHLRPENDPEKDKSGIGLSNVRQRLQLLYPGKQHELLIRETGKEFFVHLTIKLL